MTDRAAVSQPVGTLKDRLRELSARPVPFGAQAIKPEPAIDLNAAWRARREEIWAKHGGRCFYCWQQADRWSRQVDHVIPKKQRGIDADWNLVPACQSCNASKGSTWASEWCSAWLLYRLTHKLKMPRQLAMQQRDIVRGQVEEIEAYHFYLQDLKRAA